jgi:hypothetical protein
MFLVKNGKTAAGGGRKRDSILTSRRNSASRKLMSWEGGVGTKTGEIVRSNHRNNPRLALRF